MNQGGEPSFFHTPNMLDDFPRDDDLAFPISPVNSVLDTLASLPRPSPSPTPSKLEFTWSSGDIPLILYDDAYIDQRVSGLFISGDNKRESVVTLDNDASHRFSHHSERFSTSSRASLIYRHRESGIMGSSASSDTIRSAATFGTRKKPSTTKTWRSSGEQSQTSEPTITEDCGTGEGLSYDTRFSQGDHLDSLVTSRVDDNQRLNIGEWYSVSSESIERAGTPSGESTYVEPPSSATRASILSESGDVGPGNMKRSPSAQTWFSVSEWDHKDRTTLDSSGPLKRTGLAFNDVDVSNSQLAPIDHPSDSTLHGFDTFLRATSVQFLIDQESFRDAEPSFKFFGISRVRSSESGDDRAQDRIMAQFRPVSRQQFHFHHAPFESPPVLRRITVNDDDASDYVSRQAHLTLKSNGVYVIHGHEVPSGDQASEQTRLYWLFEYLVDDRRVESSSGSRRYLEGEKTFTPLTFSCSPRLLLPSQAKRINIMHVFKKSLAPKLVAEKLQVRLGTHRSDSNPPPEKTFSPKVPNYRTGHSHDRGSRGEEDDAPSKRAIGARVSSTGPFVERKSSYGTDGGRHTTAFAQEYISRFSTHILSSPEANRNSGTNANGVNHPAFPHGSPALDRHIVPPARLSELLIQDSSSPQGHASGRVTPGSSGGRASFLDTSERDSKTFVGLSPRPKRPASLKII